MTTNSEFFETVVASVRNSVEKIHKTEKQAKEEFFLKKVLTRGRNCYIIAHALLRCGAEKTAENNLTRRTEP